MVQTDIFIHEKAICETVRIGNGTRVWPFAHVLPGAAIGDDCNICENVFIENDVIVGSRVTVKCGVQLWDGIRICDDVFIGPNATFTNDKTPRSKKYQQTVPQTTVGRGATIGANATILPGVTIGRFALVGAGAVVTKDVPAYALVTGNPAKVMHFVSDTGESLLNKKATPGSLTVLGCALTTLPVFRDSRGALLAIEHGSALPFTPHRTFVLMEFEVGERRGDHAHKACSQFLLALNGAASVFIDDGLNREEIVLDDPSRGLHLPPLTWCSLISLKKSTVIQVFASHSYEESDYIRDYERFVDLTRS